MKNIKITNILGVINDRFFGTENTNQKDIKIDELELHKIPALGRLCKTHFSIKNIEVVNINDRLPNVEYGSFLVYAPRSFPKNSRWLVAEYYDDCKGFYSESSEMFLEDVTHWCNLSKDPL